MKCVSCGKNTAHKVKDRYGMTENIKCDNCHYVQVNQPFKVWRKQ